MSTEPKIYDENSGRDYGDEDDGPASGRVRAAKASSRVGSMGDAYDLPSMISPGSAVQQPGDGAAQDPSLQPPPLPQLGQGQTGETMGPPKPPETQTERLGTRNDD